MAEAIFATAEVVEVNSTTLDDLKRRAAAAPGGRFRLCLHHSTEHALQEMAIALRRGTYVRPHRHRPEKSKSYHLIDGEMVVFLFDDQGRVVQQIEMGPPAGGKTFLLRLVARWWYLPLARSPLAVYHESSPGPYVKEVDVEYAPWSPAEEDLSAVAQFLAQLGLEPSA